MSYAFPLKFKAAILEESHQPLVLDEVIFEGPLLEGQVLVKVLYSGICGKQVEEISAHFGPDQFLPHMLGHEGCGVVEDIGTKVSTVKPGDTVVLHWMKGSGIESELPVYKRRGKKLNAGKVTTFNQYAIVSENRVTSISKTFDKATACLLGCGITTGVGSVLNEAKVSPGQSVLVWGTGGVGLAVIQAAKLSGAKHIVAVDKKKEALERAQKNGATACLQGELELEDFKNKSIPHGFDKAFICVNSPDAISLAHPSMGTPSEMLVVGVPAPTSYVKLDA